MTGQGDERTGGDMEEYRQLIETTFRSLKDAVFVVKHPERVIETCNPAAEQMFGWDASELVGSSTRRLHVDDAHYERFGRESEQALAEKGRYQGEFRMRRADGSTLFTEHVVSFVGSSDDPDRAVSVVRDITERKEMEESLRKQERLYRTLFEEAGEGFLIQSLDDVVLDGNEAACELLGYPRDELQGMSLEQITPDALQEESGSGGIVRHLLNKHGSTMFYWHYVRHDGTEVPVEKSITPIMHHGTEAVLVCIRDRTELERIRKKDERKSSFVSQVTHDLRTPLNSITGMGGLLMDTDLSGKQQNYLQTILNAARNMERLTNDILDLNRIERNELLLDEEPFHPQQLLGEVISLYGQQVGDRDVVMSTQVSEDVPERLIGDPARLKQILHNLVDNALKHTQEGRIQIDIDCEQQNDASVVLSVSVSDTGSGIPDSDLADIFEEHKQVDKNGTGSELGLGLGLSICRNLVELMNGDIEVESEIGQGTTFTFTVELREASPAKENGSVVLDEVKVLLVEDNAMIRRVFRTYLESHDVNTEECNSGQAALKKLAEADASTYDVVFLDRRLGDVSGEEVLQALADTESGIDPEQVYLVSGDPAERVQELIDPLPCAGVMEKPIDEAELINAVSSVVLTQNTPAEDRNTDELQDDIRDRSPDPFHVQVVDDDQNTRILLKELLRPVADELTFVTNGKEAVKERFDKPPHLILMDLEMPEMNGLEATETIREQEEERQLPHVPIITQTARAMRHVETKCLDAGADKFVRKPIKKRRLYRSILDTLS